MRRGYRFASSFILAVLVAGPGLSEDVNPVGEQKIAFIIADQPGIPFPHTPAEIRDMLFSQTNRSVDKYWREVSYGKAWATGDVFGPVLLNKAYGDELTSQNEALSFALKTLGNRIDAAKYNHIAFAYPIPTLSGWNGHAGLGCVFEGCPADHPPKVVYLGAPPTRMSNPAYFVILHELTHSLGTGHSITVDFAPDALGPSGAEGQFTSDNPSDSAGNSVTPMGGPDIFGHLEAPMKYQLGWLDKPAGVVDVETSGTFRLEPLETPAGGLKAIRVRRAPGSDRWLWVEYRQPIGLDQAIASSSWSQVLTGVMVYYEEPPFVYYDLAPCPEGSRMCNTYYLLDMTADTTPHTFSDSALAAGKSWSDPHGPVRLSAAAVAGGAIDVTVTYETPCATFSPSSRSHEVPATTAEIDVTAPPGCNWTASTYQNPNWLTITSGASGSGSGKVRYSVTANNTYRLRKSWITIARQTFPVSQTFEKVAPVGKRAEPDAGRSIVEGEAEMCFVYGDKNGWDDIQRAYVLFNSNESLSNACYVEYDRGTRQFRLGDDAGTGWASAHHPDHPGNPNPENSSCTIRMGAPPGYNGDPAGEEFYTCLHILFKRAILGTKNTYLKAVDSAGLESAWTKAGTWTVFVNEPPQPVSVTPDSGSGASQTFRAVVSDPNGSIDIRHVYLDFGAVNDSRLCRVWASISDRVRLYLFADDNQSTLAVTTPGAAEARQNSNCGFLASGASVTLSGNDVTIVLPMLFTRGFAGVKDVTLKVWDVSALSASKKVGSWTVPDIACSYMLDPGGVQVDPYEAKGTFRVTTADGCPWIAGSSASWIQVNSGPGGAGSATVSYTVLTNTTAAARTGTISVGGQSFNVSQAGRAAALSSPLFQYPNAVFNAASMEVAARFVPSTWYAIKGTNLAPRTRIWGASDFNGNGLPTALDGVWVSVNGKPAPIYYASPEQINFLSPDDDGAATAVVRVFTPAGTTQYEIGFLKANFAPAFFMFEPENRKYIAAVHPDGAYLGKTGLYQGLNFRPAKPGDIVLLYGTGFGETDPHCKAGELVTAAAPLHTPVSIRIGGKTAEVKYAGLVSSGLYQLNVVVPDLPSGDHPVAAQIGGVSSQANASITVLKP